VRSRSGLLRAECERHLLLRFALINGYGQYQRIADCTSPFFGAGKCWPRTAFMYSASKTMLPFSSCSGWPSSPRSSGSVASASSGLQHHMLPVVPAAEDRGELTFVVRFVAVGDRHLQVVPFLGQSRAKARRSWS